jgi:protein-S-isoprenylcysteine O-methyltransferase Ste14
MALQEQFTRQGNFLFKNRGHLPLIVIVAGLLVFIVEQLNGNCSEVAICFSFKFWYEGCFLIGLIGFFIRCHVVGYAPDRTSGRNTKCQVADELNTSGMYSLVRHPLYLANFLMWLSAALLTTNLWFTIAFIFFYIIYYERIMFAEEAFLREKFKKEYLNWAEKIPAVIPSFSNYIKTNNSFKLKDVLKREKNGLLSMFILFWLFEFIENSIHQKDFYLEMSFWFYGFIVMLVYYIILKFLKITKLF